VLVLDDAVLAAPHGSRSTGHAITAHLLEIGIEVTTGHDNVLLS
jgi:hypothetical protein